MLWTGVGGAIVVCAASGAASTATNAKAVVPMLASPEQESLELASLELASLELECRMSDDPELTRSIHAETTLDAQLAFTHKQPKGWRFFGISVIEPVDHGLMTK